MASPQVVSNTGEPSVPDELVTNALRGGQLGGTSSNLFSASVILTASGSFQIPARTQEVFRTAPSARITPLVVSMYIFNQSAGAVVVSAFRGTINGGATVAIPAGKAAILSSVPVVEGAVILEYTALISP